VKRDAGDPRRIETKAIPAEVVARLKHAENEQAEIEKADGII
jgi:hypothetical protein